MIAERARAVGERISAANGGAAIVGQRLDQVDTPRLERGEEAAYDARDHRHAAENAMTRASIVTSRLAGNRPAAPTQGAMQRRGESEPGEPACRADERALDNQLARQPAGARADRGSNGNLAPARRARASCRLATFAVAVTRSSATAARRISSPGRTSAVIMSIAAAPQSPPVRRRRTSQRPRDRDRVRRASARSLRRRPERVLRRGAAARSRERSQR